MGGGSNLVVAGVCTHTDENGRNFGDRRDKPWPSQKKTSLPQDKKLIHILFSGGLFQGASMMISREILSMALPFPDGIDYHDMWLSLIALSYNRAAHVQQVITRYRAHEGTVTKHGEPPKKKERLTFLRRIFRFKPFVIKALNKQNTVLYCESILKRCPVLPKNSKRILEFTIDFYMHHKSRLFRLKNILFYFRQIHPALHWDFTRKQTIRTIFEYVVS